jgi:DNA-binding response OmpR family regulator
VKALLVTDAEWVRNDVAASLPPGWELDRADSREAVEVAARVEPEAILVDLQVGSMGGFAVVRALRDAVALGQLDRSHLILLLDRSADTFLVARSGADGSLIKPFTAQELRRALVPTTEPNPEGQ